MITYLNLRSLAIKLVKLYQAFCTFGRGSCTKIPTCSNYTIDVLSDKKSNIVRSIYLITKRLLSCNPFAKDITLDEYKSKK